MRAAPGLLRSSPRSGPGSAACSVTPEPGHRAASASKLRSLLPPCGACLALAVGRRFGSSGRAGRRGLRTPRPCGVEWPASTKSLSLGGIKIHCLTDGAAACRARWMFKHRPVLSRSDESAWFSAPQIPEAELLRCFPGGRASLSFGCCLAQLPSGQNVLMDTSLGCLDPPIFPAMTKTRPLLDLRGLLQEAAGIGPENIDVVVHSHLHRDHTGWNVVRCGEAGDTVKPLFTNARHIVQRSEWAYWTSSAALRARCRFSENLAPLEARGMIELVDGPCEVVPGVTLLPCPGHTPGHQVARLSGTGASAYFVGDALHQVPQVQNPHWSPVFDWCRSASLASRLSLLEGIASEKALLLSPHFPFPGVGYIAREKHGFSYREYPEDAETP